METNPQGPACPGIWNRARFQPCSEERRAMLQAAMKEAKVVTFQKETEWSPNETVKGNSGRAGLSSPWYVSAPRSGVSRRRSAEACRAGNSYAREKFRRGATRDLEKEKKKLQDLFSMGSEAPPPPPPREPPSEKDRYEEVLEEIIERKQFLADMTSMGQERDYVEVINSQISQKMRELALLEIQREEKAERAEKARSEAAEKSEHVSGAFPGRATEPQTDPEPGGPEPTDCNSPTTITHETIK